MALERFGFIVIGDQFENTIGSEQFKMKVVGIKKPNEAIEIAQAMVDEGIQAIELCGAFGPVWTAKILEAVDYQVPIGAVTYGPESIPKLLKVLS